MKKKVIKKTGIGKRAIFGVGLLGLVLIILVCVAVFSGGGSKVEIKDYGFGFVNTARFVNVMKVPGTDADVTDMLCKMSPDGSILIDGDKVEYEGESLSSQLPIFFDNNSYIYIPWEKAVFLDNELSVKTVDGLAFLIKDGFFGEDYTLRDSGKNLLLLSCTKNLYLSVGSFDVTTLGESFTVNPMDFVLFDGYNIRIAHITEETAERSSHGINKESLVTVDGRTYVMSDFLETVGLSVERDSMDGGLESIGVDIIEEKKEAPKPIEDKMFKIPEETFQYFLGHRYVLPKDLDVYSLNGTWYQKRDDLATTLESIPIYGEEFIYLPADYGIIDTGTSTQKYLPAFSKIERVYPEVTDEDEPVQTEESDEAEQTEQAEQIQAPSSPELFVYPFGDGEKKLLPKAIIHDGKENYIFTDSVTVKWKDSSFRLAPLSYVSFDGVDRLEFYDVGEDKFYSYILETDSIKVTFDDGSGVDVVARTVLIDGKDGMIVANEPAMYKSFFD